MTIDDMWLEDKVEAEREDVDYYVVARYHGEVIGKIKIEDPGDVVMGWQDLEEQVDDKLETEVQQKFDDGYYEPDYDAMAKA